MRFEVDVRRARAGGRFEGESHAAIGQLADGIVGKRWPQQVPAHSLEPLAIAAIDGRRDVRPILS